MTYIYFNSFKFLFSQKELIFSNCNKIIKSIKVIGVSLFHKILFFDEYINIKLSYINCLIIDINLYSVFKSLYQISLLCYSKAIYFIK